MSGAKTMSHRRFWKKYVKETRKNFMLHNVGEAPKSTWEEEKNWDVQSFNNIMRAMQLDYTFERVARFSRRLGARTEGRMRPLLVGLRGDEIKNNILADSKKLTGTHLNNVTVAPDLTKRQREADQKVREDAISRNSQLSAADRAKNLRWVAVGQKGWRKLIKKRGDTPGDHSHQQSSQVEGPQQQPPTRKRKPAEPDHPTNRRPRVEDEMPEAVAVSVDHESEEETEEETRD